MNLLKLLLNHPVAVRMFYFGLIVLGIVSVTQIPIELSTNINLPVINITASWPNTSAQIIEAEVTSKIESMAQSIPGVVNTKSETYEGGLNIAVEFEENINIQFVELLLNEKINSLKKEFPQGVSWPILHKNIPEDLVSNKNFITLVVYGYQNEKSLRELVEEKIALPLETIKGVADVQLYGGSERIINVKLDRTNLNNLNVDIPQVLAALSKSSITVGKIKRFESSINLIVDQTTNATIAELEKIPLAQTRFDRLIFLKDVAQLTHDFLEPNNISRINGYNYVRLNIEKEKGFSILKTSQLIRDKISLLRSVLPENIYLLIDDDKSFVMRRQVDGLKRGAVLSILGILILLILIYRNIKTATIIMSSIIFSICCILIVFAIAGWSVNILTLAAITLGLGLIIDNSIVIYDSIYRQFEERKSNNPTEKKQYVVEGVRKILGAIISSNITTVIALLPAFFLIPALKYYFSQFILPFIVIIFFSLLVSLTLIPSLFYHTNIGVMKYVTNGKEQPKYLKFYRKILFIVIKHRKLSFLVIFWLFGFPIWLLPDNISIKEQKSTFNSGDSNISKSDYLKDISTESYNEESEKQVFSRKKWEIVAKKMSDFYNQSWGNEGFSRKTKPILFKALGGASYRFFRFVHFAPMSTLTRMSRIQISFQMPNNINIEQMDQICQKFEQRVREFSYGILKIDTNIISKKSAEINIIFDKKIENTTLPIQLHANLVEYALNFGDIQINVAGVGPSFSNVGLDNDEISSFSSTVQGPNFKVVRELAEEFASELAKNPRIQNITFDKSSIWDKNQKEITYELNRKNLTANRFNNYELVREIRKTNNEQFVTIKDGVQKIDLLIYEELLGPSQSAKLAKTIISGREPSNRKYLRLSDVIKPNYQKVMPVIRRENQRYTRLVGFDYVGSRKYGENFEKKSIASLSKPFGYSFSPSTSNWFDVTNSKALYLIGLLSIFLVWTTCCISFESIKAALYALIAIPFSLIGFFSIFYLLDANFDRGGFLALLLLIGIAVNNSIILVSILNRGLTTKYHTNDIYALAATRLRPVFSTTVTTVIGIIPLVLSSSDYFSLGIGVIGGLISSSILVILIVPILFARK